MSEQQQSYNLQGTSTHIGITGNERADQQAKLGSEKLLLKILMQITNITDRNKTPLLHYANRLTSKNKNNLRLITHIVSDQSQLLYSTSKRDPNESPYCMHCPTTPETADHYMAK